MKTEFYKHQASGQELCRPMALPHLETFAELFTDAKPFDAKTSFSDVEIPGRSQKIGSYICWRDNYQSSMSGRPADTVLSRIVEGMIDVENDRTHFELVNHDNGWTLVLVSYGQILGSLWLAYIRTDSIPKSWRASFTGCLARAIGKHYPFKNVPVLGWTEKEAVLNLYKTHDHISMPKLTPAED